MMVSKKALVIAEARICLPLDTFFVMDHTQSLVS